jgi:hypothetical protein
MRRFGVIAALGALTESSAVRAEFPHRATKSLPGLLPHTVQLCIHCRERPAGFWVSSKGGKTVRRPWCLSCCDGLDQSRRDVVPFDSLFIAQNPR